MILLRQSLGPGISVLRNALAAPECERIRTVVLEYDFRRRGLRMDCVLLADGLVLVLEFKRAKLGAADRDQVTRYAVNLLEFHEATRHAAEEGACIVVPMLVSTSGRVSAGPHWPGIGGRPWPRLANETIECDADSLAPALRLALQNRQSDTCIAADRWLNSRFLPSSSIVDAAVSLYGGHDVAAVRQHGAAVEQIQRVTEAARAMVADALDNHRKLVVFVSGAPGAGKTLVGLDLALRGPHAAESVFVTGNAPLVDVLRAALEASYRSQVQGRFGCLSGFRRADTRLLSDGATFKIVTAHQFLGERGTRHGQQDGRVLIFDEAQRTYAEGTRAAGVVLERDEADLVLRAQHASFPEGGLVVVALIGHNQSINSSERGAEAWLDAAEREGWDVAVSDETVDLLPSSIRDAWRQHRHRIRMQFGHLEQSIRYYRNKHMAEWADAALGNEQHRAKQIAGEMATQGDLVWIFRDLAQCKRFIRSRFLASDRIGLIGSGQGRRLAAEGLFVDRKASISNWMLLPSSDCRSSNALEEVQNQYQIQGLELDGTVVCWDIDLRRVGNAWSAFKMNGSRWVTDRRLDVALNGYRVLLTRARRELAILVPYGDRTGTDHTRDAGAYQAVFDYLKGCGAQEPVMGEVSCSSTTEA